MRIGNIEFPDRLLSALRNGSLVLFAGAGVSKAKPAELPGFRKLAKKIAANTGQSLGRNEPPERFLGRLEHDGVKVQERAASYLSGLGPRPTDLHRNLLRLSKHPETVRIVTTNFDTLFEDSAEESLKWKLEVYQAPALPLGSDFRGLVHVHGAIGSPRTLVLTEADFGRAYLTQGWARRFLVDLFRSFTVVFVGYSHKDVIMNYLTRALPAEEIQPRFALTHEAGAEQWKLLGIEPLIFQKPSKRDYSVLYNGIQRLADYMQRSILDWKREVIALAEGENPPIDDGELAVLEEALSDITKLRFFTGSASSPEWIDWLNEQGYLDNLFGTGKLSECDRELGLWLATSFAGNHSEGLFLLIAKHEMPLHPYFWFELGRAVGLNEESLLDDRTLSQWVSLLLATSPAYLGETVLSWLGKRCVERGLTNDLLEIFDAMVSSRLLLRPGLPWPSDDAVDSHLRLEIKFDQIGDHHSMNELWEKGLKPKLDAVAQPLLTLASRHLAEQHRVLSVWNRGNRWLDRLSYHRQAIEPHSQDSYPNEIDVLIDVARDCIEWLSCHEPERAARWCDQLVQERSSLLRRIGIHALVMRTDLGPNEKIDWLIANTQLRDQAARHELFRALRKIYPNASTKRRRHLLDAVRAFRWPKGEPEEIEHLTSRQHFDWLHWLHDALPSCDLTKQALDEVKRKYPDWEPREYPDLSYWTEGAEGELIAPRSPWSVEEILETPITEEWVDNLVSYRPADPLRLDWQGLSLAIAEAAKKNLDWGIELADQLRSTEEWDTDLWDGLLNAFQEADANENHLSRILRFLSREEVQEKHPDQIARFLQVWVRNSRSPHPVYLLEQANGIADNLWPHLKRDLPSDETDDWLTQAINHPAGYIAEYWIVSFSLWRQGQEKCPGGMSELYRDFATMIVNEATVAGRLARCIFAQYLSFLLAADENWTRDQLLPWFYRHDEDSDYQAVWDGFLMARPITPQVAEHMRDPLLDAIERINTHFSGEVPGRSRAEKLVGVYALVLAYFADDPLGVWIPPLFKCSGEKDHEHFAFALRNHLSRMTAEQKREWWDRWLRDYWKNRLECVPAALKPEEVKEMLNWLPFLEEQFSEAVDLAIQMPNVQLEYSPALHYIAKSDLWQKYPKAVARLFIFLGECGLPSPMWRNNNCQEIFDKLQCSELPNELEKRLQELAARLGLRLPGEKT